MVLKVVIGFVATAWASLIAMVFQYVVTRQESNNMLDISIHKAIQKILRKVPPYEWASVSETVRIDD